VEVLTPAGNWSSHPPHKHDHEQRDAAGKIVEANLEEIYYFRTQTPSGFGMHRTYDLDAGWDVSTAVHDGDAFLVPSGYHGPCIANPDAALWYLNVLAGPATERSLAFSDDPAHAHVRDGWANQVLDPRVPMTSGE
jgi:5-deoxy-glucuronate isomerase